MFLGRGVYCQFFYPGDESCRGDRPENDHYQNRDGVSCELILPFDDQPSFSLHSIVVEVKRVVCARKDDQASSSDHSVISCLVEIVFHTIVSGQTETVACVEVIGDGSVNVYQMVTCVSLAIDNPVKVSYDHLVVNSDGVDDRREKKVGDQLILSLAEATLTANDRFF